MNVLLKHRKKQADDVQTFTEKETPETGATPEP